MDSGWIGSAWPPLMGGSGLHSQIHWTSQPETVSRYLRYFTTVAPVRRARKFRVSCVFDIADMYLFVCLPLWHRQTLISAVLVQSLRQNGALPYQPRLLSKHVPQRVQDQWPAVHAEIGTHQWKPVKRTAVTNAVVRRRSCMRGR